MNLINYKPTQITKIEQMKVYQPSINELIQKYGSEKVIEVIKMLLREYLQIYNTEMINSNKLGVKILIDEIISQHGNLELQEVEFLIKKGLVGTYGPIYSEIRIDTIFNWIIQYKENHRINRPEPGQKQLEYIPEKGDMTLVEYFKKNPEAKNKVLLHELLLKAKQYKCDANEAKMFYELKGMTGQDYKDDIEIISKQYFEMPEEHKKTYSESDHLKMWINQFIIENYNKSYI